MEQMKILSVKYDKEWNESEKEWYNWDINKLVAWFEYKLRNNNCRLDGYDHLCNLKNICFKSIIDTMRESKFRMNHLTSVEEDELKEYGFENDEICELLCDEIDKLCQKYPKPRKNRKNREDRKTTKKN